MVRTEPQPADDAINTLVYDALTRVGLLAPIPRGILGALHQVGGAVSEADLAAAGARAETRSERVLALMGIPSVAEAAALAGGGLSARLILPRIAVGSATCALAVSEERS